MRPAVRIVVVGLAAATYGTASLTGGWLETPPWWDEDAARYASLGETARADLIDTDLFIVYRRDGSSAMVASAGLVLAGLGASRGRRRPVTPP